jgi:Spy/CpxP family protein refolding chaperone
MRRIVFWALLGLSLSANAAVAAVVLGGRLPGHGPTGAPLLFAKVSLDPDQRARIMALREKLLADREAQAARLAELRGKLADLLAADPTDPTAVDAALGDIEAGQAGFQRRVVAHVLAVREVLRPEQRPAFQALVAEHMRTGVPLDLSAAAAVQGGRP